MQRSWSIAFGIVMILSGMLALSATILLPALGVSLSWLAPWRFWPMIVLAVGSLLFLGALNSMRRPALGALFIPAVPISVVGITLLYASVFNQWHVWSYAWSLVVLSIAVGFLLAAAFARSVWYGIPTIIIGINGMILTFCSLTGLWSWWSVFWTAEPLAIGLILLLIGFKVKSRVVGLVGLGFCCFAAFAFSAMTGLIVFGGWILGLMGPALLVLLGILLVGWSVFRRPMSPVIEQG